MGVMKTFWEEWMESDEEERESLDPLDYEDPRYDEEMEWWDAEEEVLA